MVDASKTQEAQVPIAGFAMKCRSCQLQAHERLRPAGLAMAKTSTHSLKQADTTNAERELVH